MRIAKEEIFGPIASIIPINTLNEAINVSNSISYGLSSSIYTNNIQNAFKAIDDIESGIVYVNSSFLAVGSTISISKIGNLSLESSSDGKSLFCLMILMPIVYHFQVIYLKSFA